MTTEYQFIDSDVQLAQVVDACADVPVISIDTEFARFNTYYPMVGLIQVYNGRDCFLIDPLPIDDLSPLADLLKRESLVKVLHACSEDIEVFQHALGVVPRPIFDTQIAAAVLGVGFSLGYQAIVEHYLSINLPKDQTRSDWLARPLTPEQLDYAALDVIHLLQVYEKQLAALEGTPKLEWIEAEVSQLGVDIPTTVEPEAFYLKLPGLWQLNRRQLNLLKALCAWREETARRENVPRNRIVDQKGLISIVRDNLASRQAFQQDAGMSPRQVRKYADEILFLRSEAAQVPESECPPVVTRNDTPVNNKKLKLLRQVANREAEKLGVAPEILIRRRHLEKLIRSQDSSGQYHLPSELGGWREPVIGSALLAALGETS